MKGLRIAIQRNNIGEEELEDLKSSLRRSKKITSGYQVRRDPVVYGFNLLTPLDILAFPTNGHANLDGKQKAEFVKELHAKV
ncbi:hypothetical protein CR513_07826, partial [Mucuna pruriens]